MKRVLLLAVMLMAVFTETCFADVTIPVEYTVKGDAPKGVKVIYELSEGKDQDTLGGKKLTLDMTNRRKAKFVIPVKEEGYYRYSVIKKTTKGGKTTPSRQKHIIRVLITEDGETSYAIARGIAKEDSVSYSDIYQSKHKSTYKREGNSLPVRYRTGHQTGDRITAGIIIGVISGLILILALRARKGRPADSLDI